MNGSFKWITRFMVVLVLAAGIGALAQAPTPRHLSGTISDYTLLNPKASPTGPYEMRGHWSAHLKGNSGKADFSADMAMELSDYWVVASNSNATVDGIRGAHTHHITMTDAMVSFDTSVCPAQSPATTMGFVLTGPVSITGNGSPAPFEAKGPSTLQVCITGGSEVPLSNVTLAFTGFATGHFGSQPIHGVVGFPRKSNDHDGDHNGDGHY